jgi:hypothetical protein
MMTSASQRRHVRYTLATLVLGLVVVGCGGGTPPEEPPASSPVDERCAQLSQEVIDAHNRGDRQAEEAAAAEFDGSPRLVSATDSELRQPAPASTEVDSTVMLGGEPRSLRASGWRLSNPRPTRARGARDV